MSRFVAAWLLLSSTLLAAEPKTMKDISYAEPKHERRTLDVYAPPEGENHPIVFWIHGGGWQAGDKTEVKLKPQAFVDKGFVFVSTNYRFVPEVTIDVMAGDIAKAIRWTYDHAAEFGGDRERIFIAGHSAGAQLAALLCTDGSYLQAQMLPLSIVAGCVPVDGDTYDVPMQITTVEQRRKDIYREKFGNEAQQKQLSPVYHIAKGKGIPPFLILHVADHPETFAQSHRLAAALERRRRWKRKASRRRRTPPRGKTIIRSTMILASRTTNRRPSYPPFSTAHSRFAAIMNSTRVHGARRL